NVAFAVAATHAFSGVVEGVQALMGWIIWTLQVEGVLNVLEAMNLVIHIGANGFPVAYSHAQAAGGELQGVILAAGGMVKTHTHGELALYAVLGNPTRLDHPGGYLFPRYEDGLGLGMTLRKKTDFSALAVEAGGDNG